MKTIKDQWWPGFAGWGRMIGRVQRIFKAIQLLYVIQ